MKPIELHKALPLRNESGEVYKWERSMLLVLPSNIQSATWNPDFQKSILTLTNGNTLMVEERLSELASKIDDATALTAKFQFDYLCFWGTGLMFLILTQLIGKLVL
jgi:uncharacterized protein YlzI (FlbEa/FlbD family)